MSSSPLGHEDSTAFSATAVDDGGRREARVGTVVWGLVLAAIGLIILTASVFGFTINAGQVFTGLLAGAGLALIIGGIISAVRSKSRAGGTAGPEQ